MSLVSFDPSLVTVKQLLIVSQNVSCLVTLSLLVSSKLGYLKRLGKQCLSFLYDSNLRMLCFDKLLCNIVDALYTLSLGLNLRFNQAVLMKEIFNIQQMLAVILRPHSSLWSTYRVFKHKIILKNNKPFPHKHLPVIKERNFFRRLVQLPLVVQMFSG